MSTPYRVAFAGFSAFERSALASTFRLSVQRQPAYEHVPTLAEGQFIVADADYPRVVDEVVSSGRVGHTVFIGAHAPKGAAAWMMRPINPLHVLRELDMLVARQGPASGTASVTIGPYSLPVGAARGPIRPWPSEGPGRRASDSSYGTETLGPATDRQAERPGLRRPPVAAVRDALLVDDSELALRFLQLKLQPLGLHTRTATTSQQALHQVSSRPPDFVFLDVDLGPGSELDGLALCRQLRRQPTASGNGNPVLVMVSASNSEADRVRGSLAGCDGFLGKPLEDQALHRVLALHGLPLAERAGARAPAA